MVFKKCEGCYLDDRTILERPHYRQEPCIFSGITKRTFFLENQKFATSKVLILNQAYVMPDITQHHFELKIRYDKFFINNPTHFMADDSRIYNNNLCDGSSEEKLSKNLIKEFVLKEMGYNNLGVEKLLTINNKLKNLNGKNVHIYIDGSVINSGSENILGMAGLNFYNENHNLIDEMYVTVENWITPIKAETLAFLIALILIYNIDNVYIYTDSETICKRFEELKNAYTFANARKIYKEQNNIYYWALIRTLLMEEKISIPTIIKIKAHSDNDYHNNLDAEIKHRIGDINRSYTINVEYGKYL
ncbi:hypothetical protein RhiirA4_485319 [Rhizophagus irregularis]|uniref:RNase H type-1 domain-containing protein n=1 Tax=Rhizophagus irregularis TaxID=588596 RepID=A0A2I1HQ26_9GLOM|nr:hypothetical protein RhiirA4_485319 [Rhizophagus irregularis]